MGSVIDSGTIFLMLVKVLTLRGLKCIYSVETKSTASVALLAQEMGERIKTI